MNREAQYDKTCVLTGFSGWVGEERGQLQRDQQGSYPQEGDFIEIATGVCAPSCGWDEERSDGSQASLLPTISLV